MAGLDEVVKPTRFYEDLTVGERRRSRTRMVTEAEIIAFARAYDPQWFHTDPEAARASAFGGLIASGLHTAVLWRQLDHEINGDIAFVCGIGWNEVRWRQPLRAGDVIHVASEIRSMRLSETVSDRGVVIMAYRVLDEAGRDLMSFEGVNLVYRRSA